MSLSKGGSDSEREDCPTAFNPPLEELAALTEEEFRDVFRNSPVPRPRYRGFLRNVAVAMGNSGERRFQPALEKLAQSSDPIIHEHACWALSRLRQECDSFSGNDSGQGPPRTGASFDATG